MIKNLKTKFSCEMRIKLRWSSFLPATLLATAVAFVIALPVSADKSEAPATSVKNDINITINEKVVKTITPPFLDQGVVYLPVRDIGELLGTLVAWNTQAKTVTMRYPELTVKVPFGSTSASVNGQPVALSTPLRMVDGRVYVPLRFFSEAVGAEVKWEATTHNVRMTKPNDYLKLNPFAIWFNRTTRDLYMAKDEQFDALSIGKLDAQLQGTVLVQYPSIQGENTVLTLVDKYASPHPHHEVYTLLIRDNQIVEQKHASYDQRYDPNTSYYQVYDPNGWIQYTVLTDGKIVWVYNDEGKVVSTYDLPELTQQDDVFGVQAVGTDFLVVRPNRSGLLTLIDLKDNSTVVLADKLLTGKNLAYAHDNQTPYPGDSLNFGGDVGHGVLDFAYLSPFQNNNGQSERLSYERPSYEEERKSLPKERSFQEMASTCSTDTVVSVDIKDGDLMYKPLIGTNKQDQEGIRTVCRILKKITAEGVEVTLPRTFPETFFHGMSVNFSTGDSVSIHLASGGKLAMGSELGGKNIFLGDAQTIKEFERLKVLPKQ
ncbi:copper amine oxidase N-terminal domain-containing protein [Paenibacillus macquariensis]|uniref:Copper amine oxidase N-terminal domain-containing protein n=1 Tax=Paenibacillus macquariensis TaxID=948756 RepID=A0ABY1KD94_9BACL|nr:copper amine oxidase N-terminal domain-containing protein [Paenibacillus macquariensis]MEC0093845.1 copper amine oxidase N-terminal domain-containing protein [Paenibacillus macquariensis]OAB26860.1 hypothetical protein PMSM_25850 [Paenibacillus macquariensis subsp. macquariensis]SIR64574.1 Copper amine oxidase N-terminal domain-containing protein [Paenibacillus macquariensis]